MAAGAGALSHYQVLGVPVTASQADIKVAYRKAARLHHPDQGGDAEKFRAVTLAYEILVDPEARSRYDAAFGQPPQPAGAWTAPAHASREADSRMHAAATRASGRNTSGDPAQFIPPLDSPSPLLTPQQARLSMHGLPRKRGIFGAEARIRRERQAMELLLKHVASAQPSVRLVNGLRAPDGRTYIDHVLLAGYRLALVDSMILPAGAYAWDGDSFRQGSRRVQPPLLAHTVRHMQELFPALNVEGWIMVLGPGASLHEPVIDQESTEGGLHVGNAANTIRSLKHFLASGPSPHVVDVPTLARLIAARY